MILTGKMLPIFVLLICMVHSLRIYKSKRIIQPIRVQAPENVNQSNQKEYIPLSAAYGIEEDEDEPSKTLEPPENNEANYKSFDNENFDANSQTTFPKRTGEKEPIVPIIENENYVYAYNGDYHYSYEGGDGTRAYQRGGLTAEDAAEDVVVGGYSYKDKDGNDYSLTYTAGENGYRPVGAHLPTPPPIPPAIQRVLRILATKTTPAPVTESLSNDYY